MSTVARWGNSLAICIPQEIADKINLKEGMAISIDVTDGKIVIAHQEAEYTLDELLAGTSSEDFDGEYD